MTDKFTPRNATTRRIARYKGTKYENTLNPYAKRPPRNVTETLKVESIKEVLDTSVVEAPPVVTKKKVTKKKVTTKIPSSKSP